MTKLWLTFHYPIALDCCCIRVVNQKKWHSFLKLLQPPSTWESSNHVNPEVPHHKKQKRLVNVKTICTCCRLIDSTTSFAYRMHLDSNHTSTGQRKGRRVGDLLKNNGLGKNRNACVTSILQIEWPQTFAERFMLIVTVNDDRWGRWAWGSKLRYTDPAIWQKLVELSNPKSVSITNSTQLCGQIPSTHTSSDSMDDRLGSDLQPSGRAAEQPFWRKAACGPYANWSSFTVCLGDWSSTINIWHDQKIRLSLLFSNLRKNHVVYKQLIGQRSRLGTAEMSQRTTRSLGMLLTGTWATQRIYPAEKCRAHLNSEKVRGCWVFVGSADVKRADAWWSDVVCVAP